MGKVRQSPKKMGVPATPPAKGDKTDCTHEEKKTTRGLSSFTPRWGKTHEKQHKKKLEWGGKKRNTQ